MVRRAMHSVFFFVFLILCGCALSSEDPGIKVFTVSSDFSKDLDTWQPEFTGYPASYQDSIEYQLRYDWVPRPGNLGSGKSLMMSGNNLGDGLFMFIKTKVTGLSPDTEYALVFGVELASNATADIDGINGSPGRSVYLKAGASTVEPEKIIDGDFCTFNLDKGSQESISGSDMVVLGDIASTTSNYELIHRNSSSHASPFIVRTDSNGSFWLMIGTDSAYQGLTTVYYTSVTVLMTVPD